MPKRTLSDDFEYKGLWWLPESPDDKIAGILSFSAEGIRLELLGLFREAANSGLRHSFDPNIILGRTGSTDITLYRAFERHSALPWGDAGKDAEMGIIHDSGYGADHLFIGAHFESEFEMKFSAFSATLTYLEEWLGREKIPFRDTATGSIYPSASYSRPEPIVVTVEALDSSVKIDSHFGSNSEMFRSMTWHHTATISVRPTESRDLEWYEDTLDSLQRLLTLFVGRPVLATSIRLFVPRKQEDDRYYMGSRMPVEYITPSYSLALREDVRPPVYEWHWRDVLVPLEPIESRIEEVLESWFAKAELLRPIHTLFFGTFYNRRLYGEAKFLNLMQALESYHARTAQNDRYIPDEEYASYQEAMLSVLPPKVREILKPKLSYGNRFSLKKRLDQLLVRTIYSVKTNLAEDWSGRTFTSFPTRDSFKKALNKSIRRIIATRNYLTHYDEKLEKSKLTLAQITEINPRLQLWLASLLWAELGIDDLAISRAIDKFADKNFVTVLRR